MRAFQPHAVVVTSLLGNNPVSILASGWLGWVFWCTMFMLSSMLVGLFWLCQDMFFVPVCVTLAGVLSIYSGHRSAGEAAIEGFPDYTGGLD